MDEKIMSYPIVDLLKYYQEDRPAMREANDLSFFVRAAQGEIDEVVDAMNNGHTEDEKASELADVAVFIFNALIYMGRDPIEEMATKIAYNHCQHPAVLYDGSKPYGEARVEGKQWCKDRHFRSEIYEVHAKE